MFTNKEPEGPPTVFGSSSYLDLHLSPFFARASFYDFAPSPFQCVCCNFLVPDDQRKRTCAPSRTARPTGPAAPSRGACIRAHPVSRALPPHGPSRRPLPLRAAA